MNEDKRGITPADSTAITLQRSRSGIWEVVIEQGNGDVIKTIELTEMERIQLATLICTEPGTPPLMDSVGFLDPDRGRVEPYAAGKTGVS